MSSIEEQIKKRLESFVNKSIEKVNDLTADKMIEESAINPLLVKALGINDFESLAKFYVYQRVGRSLVTSFGTEIEYIVRIVAHGTKGSWWDVETKIGSTNYHMSVKSGPRDMDKDQVTYFSREAKKLMKKDLNALPIIAMGYGKALWPVIRDTLKKNGLDPNKHALFGKKLYTHITGDPDYHKKLLGVITTVKSHKFGDITILSAIEDKVEEMAKEFKKKYKDLDELLIDTF